MRNQYRFAIPAAALWLSEALALLAQQTGLLVVCLALSLLGLSWLRKSASLLVIGMCLLVGMTLSSARAAPLKAPPIAEMASDHAVAKFEATVTSPPRVKESPGFQPNDTSKFQWSISAELDAIDEAGQRWDVRVPVRISGSASARLRIPELIPGSRIGGNASFRSLDEPGPQAALLFVRGPPAVVAGAPIWQRGAQAVRTSMVTAATDLPPNARGLLPGLVVGDENGISEQLRSQMQATGMSHLTAVSGSNLAIVSGLVLLIARTLRIRRAVAIPVAGLAIVGFIAIVGPQASVVRAAGMAGVMLIALLSGRSREGFNVLLVAVVLLLLLDPWLSISVGFCLSVAATAGLLAFASTRKPGPRTARGRLTEALGVCIAAQLATAPIVAGFGNGLPLVGVLGNLLAAPAVAPATILGLAAALSGLISPTAATAFATLAGFPTQWIAGVAEFSAGVPVGVLPWPGGVVGVTLAALGSVSCVVAFRFRRLIPPRPAVAALVAVTLAVWFVREQLNSWPPPGWAAVFCDVGQGDATVLSTGDGHAIVVDAGPDPVKVNRCLSDLGISAVDLLVLTHFHADHVEGLPGLTNGRTVGRVLVSPLADPVEETTRVDDWLASVGAQATRAQVGETGAVGAVAYQVLWPSALIQGGSAPNNSSVTLVVETNGMRLLLPGDLEPEAQAALMSAQAPVGVDAIKIPHHGSRYQDPDLIAWSSARLAVASVGAGNRYGHPSEETLDAWSAAGADVARTDLDGDVALTRADEGTPTLVTRN